MFDVDGGNTTFTVSFVALATLSSVIVQKISVQSSELWSELLSWIIVPVLFRSQKAPEVSAKPLLSEETLYPTTSISLWLVALSLAVSSCYKAEFGIVKFWPLLTVLLLAVQRFYRTEVSDAKKIGTSWFSLLANTIWGTAITGLIGVIALSNDDFARSAISLVAVVAMLFTFAALLPRSPSNYRFLPRISNIEEDIFALSWRVVLFLALAMGVQIYAFGLALESIIWTILLGLAKSSLWYFLIRTSRHVSWNIATLIGTFGLMCSRNPFMQFSDLWAFSHIFVAFLSLGQIVHTIPQQYNARSWLWAMILLPLIPYVMNNVEIQLSYRRAYQSFTVGEVHPVQALVENALIRFEHTLRQQSKSYAEAYHNYQQRYGRDPPPGFEAWYTFAVANKSPIIDDFDTMYDSISPYWNMSGQEIIQKMNAFYDTGKGEAWSCTLSSAMHATLCTHPSRTNDRFISLLFSNLLSNLSLPLPDIKFLVNHLDEPRLMTSPHVSKRTTVTVDSFFNLTTLSEEHTWDEITKPCGSAEIRKENQSGSQIETYGLPFVTDIRYQIDLCQHPEYSQKHGLFVSPVSFRLIEGMLPILSTGSPSTMGDILYPSPAYSEPEFQYNSAFDVEWESKSNNLYWAGSSSGGYAKDDDWRSYHRQRFVELAQNLGTNRLHYLQERSGVVESIESTFVNTRLFDVAFTQIYQCERKFCRDQRSYFNVRAWAGRDTPLKSRLVFDIDGNGISGRYYKLLASKSVPLKQTLFREWHDDRLKPWVHYIPVSLGMEELPELVTYLTSNQKGQQIAQDIAERGRDWYNRAFREVDQSIYLYRLMLELANLQDLNRPRSR